MIMKSVINDDKLEKKEAIVFYGRNNLCSFQADYCGFSARSVLFIYMYKEAEVNNSTYSLLVLLHLLHHHLLLFLTGHTTPPSLLCMLLVLQY